MSEASATFEWRIGRLRVTGALAIHALSAFAVAAAAQRWPIVWSLLGFVAASVAYDVARVWRDRGRVFRLRCTPFGVTIDDVDCVVRDAWLALGWTVLWLRDPRGRTRLLYVHRAELTSAQFAALRRHVKALAYA
jgi:hypothetical protein